MSGPCPFPPLADLNAVCARVHLANAKWWTSLETGLRIERNLGEICMLVVSELAEALEGHRKGLMDDKLPHRRMPEVELADAYIRLADIGGALCPGNIRRGSMVVPAPWTSNFAENLLLLTDMVIGLYIENAMLRRTTDQFSSTPLIEVLQAIEELSVREGFDLSGAFEEKMAYNAIRADHQLAARKLATGKKY